jgi:UDP-N-acetylmuramate dehydrogenase
LKKTHEIVLSVTLLLPPLDQNDAALEVVKFRAAKQPKGNVAGSFFKNPVTKESAGFLIDKAGLKGTREGGIEISLLHGNWLMNTGGGTQKNVIDLARKIKKDVYNQFKIELEPENIVIDERGNKVDI